MKTLRITSHSPPPYCSAKGQGALRKDSIDDFIDAYGRNAPVGWGWGDALDSRERSADDSMAAYASDDATIPEFPTGDAVGSFDDVTRAVRECVDRDFPGMGISSCELIGNGSYPSDVSCGSSYVGASYVITLDGGASVGIRVSCDGDSPRAVTSNLLPIYDDLAYDVQSGEYINTPGDDATAMSDSEQAEAEALYERMGDEGKAE